MKTLDCRAHKCPHPVVETRKALLAAPDAPLRVLLGDPIAVENVSRLVRTLGFDIKTGDTEGGVSLELTPGSTTQKRDAAAIQGKTVALVAADTLGSGSDELGRILLKNYFFTLTELEVVPDVLLFVNAGVKLTCAGSEVLEALDKIACMGTDIASCGLCLEFFHLKGELKAGRSTNMLEIAETLQHAGRIIRL
jgi:selenium metabolism protein YedF